MEVVNRYIDNEIRGIGFEENYDYKNAKISLDGLNLVYDVENLRIKVNDNFLFFPEVKLKIRVINLLRRRFRIEELNIGQVVSYIDLDSQDFLKIYEKTFSSDHVSELIHRAIMYLHSSGHILKSLKFDSSVIYFSNGGNGATSRITNKIELSDSTIHLRRRIDETELGIDSEIRINGEAKTTKIFGNCSIFQDRNIRCRSNVDNISVSALHFTNTAGSSGEFGSIAKNIIGLFDLEFTINFSDYTTLEDCNFSMHSDGGKFNLKQFFDGEITFKNLSIQGETHGYNILILKNLSSKLLLGKNVDLSMSLEIERKKYMKISIDANNALAKDVKTVWPVFLDNLEIRDWLAEHILDGHVKKATARINFDHGDNGFNLSSIDSELFVKGAKLNYHSDFPEISNIDAKIVFTVDDMNIYVDSANIAKTLLKNGKIHLNFNDEQFLLDISAKTFGKVYEAMYFINNGEREKIEKIVTTYANGVAFLDVDVKIPIREDIDLSDISIGIVGEVKNNNTFILADQSNFRLNILKKFKSKIFSGEFDLANSAIDFKTIDFVKAKNQGLKISLNINVNDTKNILLNGITAVDGEISFRGSGAIKNGTLDKLILNNVKYGNNDFNVSYRLGKDFRGIVQVAGQHINFGRKFSKRDLEEYLSAVTQDSDSVLNNCDYSIKFENFLVNEKYNLRNMTAAINFTAGAMDYFDAQIDRGDDNFASLNISKVNEQESNNKYLFRIECSDLGKFLSELGITDNLVHGDLYLNGNITTDSKIEGNFRLKNKFSYITEDAKNKNMKFFSYILNSDELPKNMKNILVSQNTMNFARLQADFKLIGNNLMIDNFLLNSDEILGIGVSGNGSMDIDSGKVQFVGLIIPLEKISMLFGINKIPLVNKLLFGKEDSGLIAVA
jgi:hypothetical protein